MRVLDIREREFNLLDLIVESYIQESRPISSSYLCKKFNLPYSSATVRNVMESLEKQGFVCHVHTSSGRVPTQVAFRRYAEVIQERDIFEEVDVPLDFSGELCFDDIICDVLEVLANVSGYTSLVSVCDDNIHKFICRGTRLMLEQPEFNDLQKFKDILYALEVKMETLSAMLDHYSREDLRILIGDEIGVSEISDCAMMVSGVNDVESAASISLALLGPMRMDYARAGACLAVTRDYLREIF